MKELTKKTHWMLHQLKKIPKNEAQYVSIFSMSVIICVQLMSYWVISTSFLNCYPSTLDEFQDKKFNQTRFEEWSLLEYSIDKERAYYFMCFLFDG